MFEDFRTTTECPRLSAAWRAHPHPRYRRAREQAEVHRAIRLGMEVRPVGCEQAGGMDRAIHCDVRDDPKGPIRPMAGALRSGWGEHRQLAGRP